MKKLAILTATLLVMVVMPASAQKAQAEQRGVWLATVVGLDWPQDITNHFEQRTELINTIRELGTIGCNALYFQVVSEMDAMYSSELLPWSRHLTGTEGVSPYFDPLALAVLAAHQSGMKIHAWINPLRVSRTDTLSRARTQVKFAHPEWVHDYNGKEYLDPGNPEVIRFLSDIAREILTKYDVDGLHIDDYFYPDDLQSDKRGWSDSGAWNDSTLYAAYGVGRSLDEWRYSNIDRLVKALHETTHEVRPGAVFGVSPQGRIANTSRLYADPRRWAAQKSVDYLVPQVYWCMDRGDFAAFGKVLPEWKNLGVPIYAGLAAYKHAPEFWSRKKDAGYRDVSEFGREIELCRKSGFVEGHIWFRARDLQKEDLRNYITDTLYR